MEATTRSAYDAIVIGAGHNSLVAAAYLGRAGRSVLVLERRERVGGTVGTEEFAAGFWGPAAHPSVETFHPDISETLRLREHGLDLRPAAGTVRVTTGRGDIVELAGADGWVEGVCRAAPGDADALVEFDRLVSALGGVLAPVFSRRLPRLEDGRLGERLDLLKLGWRLRRLGSRDALEALRILPMNVRDVLDERFETPALAAALAWPAFSGSWVAPRSAGSVFNLLYHRPAWSGGLLASPVVPAGGPGGLTDALRSAAEASGVEIVTEAPVRAVVLDGNRAAGVVTGDGREIGARAVVSGLDPRTTLLDLLPPGTLAPDVMAAVRAIRARGTAAVVKLAVDRLPAFWTPGDAGGRLQVGASLDEIEQAFDHVKYGSVPDAPVMDVTVPSAVDGTLAPAGRHVVVAWLPFVPTRPRDGSWADARDGLLRRVQARLDALAPGFSDSVVAASMLTPEDIEARFGIPGGCLSHVEMALDQVLYMRPAPGWYDHATPVRGLFVCGPGTHPGGGVTGLPGRHAAQRVLRDGQ